MVAYSGGGPPPIAGLSSDGDNGVVIVGGITAGDGNKTPVPDFNVFNGANVLQDAQGNQPDQDEAGLVRQIATLVQDNVVACLRVVRQGSIGVHNYTEAVLLVEDTTLATGPMARWRRGGIDFLLMTNTGALTLAVSDQIALALGAGSARGNHMTHAGKAPTITHNGTNAAGTLITATDLRGLINVVLTSTGSLANAELCTIAFADAYEDPPGILLSALDDATATALPLGTLYADQSIAGGQQFLLKCTSALPAGTYRVAYLVIG